MKVLILIFALLIFSGCASHASSVLETNKTAQPTPTAPNANFDPNSQPLYADYKVDSAKRDKFNEENERFSVVPDEFKSVDFENFKYNFGRMKNGEYEENENENQRLGGETFNFSDVYYVDLVGDEKKEAVVFLSRVGCGGSCDGGSELIYFYASNKGKAKFIDSFWSGSRSSGCSLKSFTLKNKKLYIEQFGRCEKNQTFDFESTSICKFCVKDETHSEYSFAANELNPEAINIVETKTMNIMNTSTLVSIND